VTTFYTYPELTPYVGFLFRCYSDPENNHDLQVEQIDQSIAEGSGLLAQGGGLPRPLNYTIMDEPLGVGGVRPRGLDGLVD
jgi:hypothetical protein